MIKFIFQFREVIVQLMLWKRILSINSKIRFILFIFEGSGLRKGQIKDRDVRFLYVKRANLLGDVIK